MYNLVYYFVLEYVPTLALCFLGDSDKLCLSVVKMCELVPNGVYLIVDASRSCVVL